MDLIADGQEAGGQMSFLEHLDELRKRLVHSVIFVVLTFVLCFAFSEHIYEFLSVPIRQALSEAARRELPVEGITGQEKILALSEIREGDAGRYIFDRATKIGAALVVPGSTVAAQVARDANGNLGLFTTEPLITNNAIIDAGGRGASDGSFADAVKSAVANTATPHPAVTIRSVGVNGGEAIAFTFDLARSIVYTRRAMRAPSTLIS